MPLESIEIEIMYRKKAGTSFKLGVTLSTWVRKNLKIQAEAN
jgi:hypothetical protein